MKLWEYFDPVQGNGVILELSTSGVFTSSEDFDTTKSDARFARFPQEQLMALQLVEVARGRLKPLARCTPVERDGRRHEH